MHPSCLWNITKNPVTLPHLSASPFMPTFTIHFTVSVTTLQYCGICVTAKTTCGGEETVLHISLPWCIQNMEYYNALRRFGIYSNIYPTRCIVTQFILSGNCCTCFGWNLHPSSGAQTTVYTASCTCRRQIAVRCDKYQMLQIQLYALLMMVELPAETCRAVSRYK